MSRLDKAIEEAARLSGRAPKRSVSRDDGRFGKAVGSVREVMDLRKATALQVEFDLYKGVHDAMFHHAAHAAAAQRASYGPGMTDKDNQRCREAAKKHTMEFLKSALENAENRDAYAMKSALQRAINYYEQEASDETYSKTPEKDLLVGHFRSGGGYVDLED